MNQWNNLLQETRGALKPETCFWYSIDFNCKEGVWEYTAVSKQEITITNSSRDRKWEYNKLEGSFNRNEDAGGI